MLDSNKVAEFFDKCASSWDDNTIRDEEKIKLILDNANVKKGAKVLDVACGTGVLIPDYLKREVALVRAIDISPAMIEKAREKFGSEENVSFVCGDVMNTDVGKDYDAIVVYNAFPHFADPEGLISRLSDLLAPGGTLTVAHGMGREHIDNHHKHGAREVSVGLISAEEMAELFNKKLKVSTVISTDELYQLAGQREL